MDIESFMEHFHFQFENLDEPIVECGCYCDKCIYRQIVIHDIFERKYVRLKVCNELIKLAYHNCNGDMNQYNFSSNSTYIGVLSRIVVMYFKYRYGIQSSVKRIYWSRSNKLEISELNINHEVCKRPSVNLSINLFEYIRFIQNVDNNTFNHLYIDILRGIQAYFEHKAYAKYKTLYKNIQGDINRHLRYLNNPSHEDIVDIFSKITIFQTKIKHYATS